MKDFDKKILIVDDEKQIRNIIKAAFVRCGYECIEAENGKIALDLLTEKNEDIFLVLTDIFMPVMSGLEFLKLVKPKYPVIEFVVLTALSSDDTVIDALKYGATSYATKPLNLDELKFMVEKLKENYIIRNENRKLIKTLQKTVGAEAENIEYKLIAEELRRELIQKDKTLKAFMDFIKIKIPKADIPGELSVYFDLKTNETYSEM